jgi:uncharacterized lipoprotein YmbA
MYFSYTPVIRAVPSCTHEKITIFRGPLMLTSNYSILKLVFSALTLLIFLAACSGGGSTIATKYYLIDPVEYDALNVTSDKPLAIEIIDVHIPQYLERFHIATRIGENRLKFSETNQWGENLRKNLMRTLSRNLSRLLSTQDIGTPLNRSSSLPDYRVQLYIEQFELGIDNKVRLAARWQISATDTMEPLAIYNEEMSGAEVEQDNYEQMVTSMRQLFGELSMKIAESILAEENK